MNVRASLASLTLSIMLAACSQPSVPSTSVSGNPTSSANVIGSLATAPLPAVQVTVTRSADPEIPETELTLIEKAHFVSHTFSNGETVDWENRSGYIVRDGDVLVMKSSDLRQRLVAYETKLKKERAATLSTQSLVVVPTSSCGFFSCSTRDVRWKSVGIIPYSFDPSLPFNKVVAITTAIDDWNNTSTAFGTPIKWQQVYNASNRVQFTAETDAGACGSSFIGMQGGVQPLKIGDGGCLTTGVLEHEMLHAAGVEHEQQRCDRDTFITVIADQYIRPERRSQFAKYCDVAHQTKTNFDYESLMLYGPTREYSVSGTTPVISVPVFAPSGSDGAPSRFGQRDGFSFDDINGLRQYY